MVRTMSKQIKIRVYSDGRIESETVGVKGKSCLGYIKEIENLTGAKTVSSQFTQEYHETEQQVYNSDMEYQQNGN